MIRAKAFVLLIFLLCSLSVISQEKEYFITFKDKRYSKFSINHPASFLSSKSIERRLRQDIPITEADLPVSSAYLDSLVKRDIKIIYTSRWLNGVLVQTTSDKIDQLSFDAIVDIKDKSGLLETQKYSITAQSLALDDPQYGTSYSQVSMLSGDLMHREGYNGKGKLIAVIDGGFKNLDKLPHFDNITKTGKILVTKDFVDREDDVYDDSDHGTVVLSVLGGYTEGELIGLAYDADYLLLRSEATNYESLFEEIYWSIAAEYADSAGADIINSSLGYNTFDIPSENHTYEQLDGKTTIVTRAAEQAAKVGMVVVTSQGNDGNKMWRYLLAPADAPSVLAVGAVNSNGDVANFSSRGPSSDGRIKPDIAAMGDGVKFASPDNTFGFGSGTSFAAPMITGLIAGLWQAAPDLTAEQLRECIKRAGSNFYNPNNEIGFGIPNFKTSLEVAKILQNERLLPYVSPNLISNKNPVLLGNSIYVNSTVTINVFSLTGVLITQFSHKLYLGENSLPFDFTSLPKGLYYLRINTERSSFLQKILVQ